MPLVTLTLKRDRSPDERRAIADAVHAALVGSIGIPPDDRFQVISSRFDEVIYDPAYLGIARSDGLVMVQVHLSTGRSVAQKKALFAAIAQNLGVVGVRPEDVLVTLVEIARENWSFGNGIAQYADVAPPHLAGAALGRDSISTRMR
ncbi:tautomerase family protein [Methylobacterium nonmethylotrophicum]|uniref:Tautomerase family protein n=1 Tax=Methylobacterium nonmethylotrophicum TaxID=1141884 RepID=A0A4Z0NJQ9_9HYPH|nr:tautomerase family protein [Methylobacterium nonmethylotrophicum]TGD96578.1 tautomerase family protein [Methylobacterium nonmethylotrophicum]